MNKEAPFYVLSAIALISIVMAGQAGLLLMETQKINKFIGSDFTQGEDIPSHLKAQFSQAFNDAKQGENRKALERFLKVTNTNDKELEAVAYYNRANIYLKLAQRAGENDSRLSYIALAKQDYRNSLLLDSSNWNARFNLEVALLMVPEEPVQKSEFKKVISQRKDVRIVGFKVDLP